MNFVKTPVPDVIIIEPTSFRDNRGFFMETFHEQKFSGTGIPTRFVQDNQATSFQHVLRGLHTQIKRPQGKLMRVVRGSIFDVAVDVRVGSPTFLKWVGVVLSDENLKELWVPPGFAHGFCVISERADVIYKCTELYDPSDEIGISWSDPRINIAWPTAEPILSKKDSENPTIDQLKDKLPRWQG